MKRSVFFFVIFSFQTITSQTITLRDTTNQFDYIIITVPEFVNACETFRQHKETVRDFRTLIVDTTQIFAEFDSSHTSQDNIRDFISYSGTFWKNPRPKFFLLTGTVTAIPNYLVPFPGTPTSFRSDYYYCQNIYENDSTTTDFYIGRVPCKNSTELTNYLSKVIDFENTNFLESWMNNALFICEDDPRFDFLGGAMSIAENFPTYIREFFIFEIDTSIYYGNIDSIYNALNNRGCSIAWFEGHSTDSSFAYPVWFNLDDLSGLTNQSKYFITIWASSQSAIVDSNTNITNEMLYFPNAGSLGGMVFVGASFWGIGKTFQGTWARRFYNPNINSLGEAFNLDSLSSAGIFGYMKKITNLWADPSLKLKYDITLDAEGIVSEIPNDYVLSQNYPNPFNPTTNIKFRISEYECVSLKVYDVLGSEIVTLVNQEKSAGNYKVEFDGANLTNGIYFYQLRAGNSVETKKMLLLK